MSNKEIHDEEQREAMIDDTARRYSAIMAQIEKDYQRNVRRIKIALTVAQVAVLSIPVALLISWLITGWRGHPPEQQSALPPVVTNLVTEPDYITDAHREAKEIWRQLGHTRICAFTNGVICGVRLGRSETNLSPEEIGAVAEQWYRTKVETNLP